MVVVEGAVMMQHISETDTNISFNHLISSVYSCWKVNFMVLQCWIVNRTWTICKPGLQTVFKPHSLCYKPPHLPVYLGLNKDGLKTNEYVDHNLHFIPKH